MFQQAKRKLRRRKCIAPNIVDLTRSHTLSTAVEWYLRVRKNVITVILLQGQTVELNLYSSDDDSDDSEEDTPLDGFFS